MGLDNFHETNTNLNKNKHMNEDTSVTTEFNDYVKQDSLFQLDL